MIRPTDIHPLTDFKRNSVELIRALEKARRPFVLTVDGRPKVVVLAVEAYLRLAALAERMETHDAIQEGLEDVKKGRTRPVEEFFDELEKKYNLRRGRRSSG